MAQTVEAAFVNVRTAVQAYGLSERTIWRHIAAGNIASVKVGGKRMLDRASIDRLFGVDGRLRAESAK